MHHPLDEVSPSVVSSRRVDLITSRHRAANLLARLVTALGGVDLAASSSSSGSWEGGGNFARGLMAVLLGLALERRSVEPPTGLSLAAAVVGGVAPLAEAWKASHPPTLAVFGLAQSFQLALNAATVLLASHLLFASTRLAQLDALRRAAAAHKAAKGATTR